ncbi:MAG: hypothetical protein Q9202_003467 [Teloschistes flavicans]
MPFFSRLRGGGPASKSKKQPNLNGTAPPPPPPKPRWPDAWLRKDVEPEEVQELLRGCTNEIKSRASDPSAARSFVRNFFNEDRAPLQGRQLGQELMLTEPMVSTTQEICGRD